MKNDNLKNLNRIEFPVTYKCISNCKHCSNSNKSKHGYTSPEVASAVINEIAGKTKLESVMVFGGEPLLYPESVFEIFKTSRRNQIARRQLITNGAAWNETEELDKLVRGLIESGVTEILVSVDAFHAEYIPVQKPYQFVDKLKDFGFDHILLSPAWLGSKEQDNAYNMLTRKILDDFRDLKVNIGEGNVIFLEGNARQNFAKYYSDDLKMETFNMDFRCGTESYTDPLDDVKSISLDPDGKVYVCSIPIGDINLKAMTEILEEYEPRNFVVGRILIDEGISGLISFAEEQLAMECTSFVTPCALCREVCARTAMLE